MTFMGRIPNAKVFLRTNENKIEEDSDLSLKDLEHETIGALIIGKWKMLQFVDK